VRLSLRWKIVGGFGLLLALIALLGWVTLSLFGSLRGVQRRVFEEAVPGLVAVDEIVRSYTAQSAAVRGALIGSQRTLLERYEVEVATARFWENRAMELFDSQEERELLTQLIEAGHRFHRLVDHQVVPLATEGNRSRAFLILDGPGARLIAEIEIQGELLRSAQEDRVVQSEQDVQQSTRRALVLLLVVVVGALAIGIVLAIVLPRRLSRNLSRLVEATRAIGRGDFEQQLDISSGDEIEELSARFTDMQAGLKRLQQLALQDRELEIAASIQRNLLQRSLPTPPGIRVWPLQRQANLVGGDWYDVDVSPGELMVVVGDASGKGIAAALMATVALSFLRAERGLGSDMKKTVERTNDALLDATDPGSFTTLVYASIELESGEARWLNMGHPAPFLLRAPGDGAGPGGHYLEGPRNRALGWYEEPGLEETGVRVDPGDCLLFFTDGWLEAKSPEGEVFGENRFAEAILRLAPLGAGSLGEHLVGEVERFAAGKLEDDLTMLIVEFEGSPIRYETAQEGTGDESWHSRR
jgi:serine phosphatase RsbU (regulator of sigma subunit)/CHASE3 domain sensor protein